jgi:hypothetical protein
MTSFCASTRLKVMNDHLSIVNMDPSTSTAFTPLATLHLTSPHVLHPQACNPTMDLVILLGNGGNSGKGKDKVGSGKYTKLALWRMSGSKVWESDVEGQVRGLAWSHDGIFIPTSTRAKADV